ncbi:hypothetical protein EU96_1056 [Prochlorococcus marinus str. MIT 9302]|uniref:YlqD protein n=2 Tax=Prochlorococcus marinus TaxID=1219 RepID=A0A0A2A9Z4_PROMR|nr:hypothetical protein EU96_1056 [Prochlorococcus marinus str. MIT 9302]
MICSNYIEKVILFFMETKNSLSIKRSIAIKAIVTPTWKEDAERELSKAISNIDQQLSQLEQEGQEIVNNIRSQSVNPLDPRVQEQVSQVQQQVAVKRNEIEEQKRNLLQQQSQVRELKMDEIVDQGQVDSFCDVTVGDNLIEKMQVSITVKDGVIQSIDNN